MPCKQNTHPFQVLYMHTSTEYVPYATIFHEQMRSDDRMDPFARYAVSARLFPSMDGIAGA